MNGRERRGYQRFSVNLPGCLKTDSQEMPVHILNLSLGGALILSETKFALWEDITLEVELHSQKPLQLAANVCWCEEGVAGVMFDSLRSEVRAFLELYLKGMQEDVGDAVSAGAF